MVRIGCHGTVTELHVAVLALSWSRGARRRADEEPKRVKYVPPEGFAGHKWGELRSSSSGCRKQADRRRRRVDAAAARNQRNSPACPMSAGPRRGAVDGCDFQATLLRLRKNFEGGGFYVLSEYTIEGQGFRYRRRERRRGAASGDLPVLRELGRRPNAKCRPSSTRSTSSAACACMFKSETREELRKLPADHVTNYDRVLEKLMAKFGRPDSFVRRGQVIIETLDGDSTDADGAQVQHLALVPGARSRPAHQLHRERGAVARTRRPAWARCCIRRRCSGSSRTRARTTASRATSSSRCCTRASRQSAQRACRNVRL